MSIKSNYTPSYLPRLPLIGALSLFFVELLVIGVTFKHGIDFNCLSNWPSRACRGPSGIMVSIYCVCAALALFAFLFPAPFRDLFANAGQRRWPLWLNIAGALIALVPVTFMTEGSGSATLVPALVCWSLGMSAILAGLLLYLAPLGHWLRFLAEEKWRLLPLIMGGIMAPALATALRRLWQFDSFVAVIFTTVSKTISMLGFDVEVYTETRVIGANGFYIDIAPACSGVEGIALVTIFVTLYLALFRSELRFPRALILYPVGILVSTALNVVRIVVLLVIGLNGNPDLAVGGFHSHAGWMMFTLVALGIIAVANTVSWVRKPSAHFRQSKTASSLPPFFQDKTVAMILPFAIFMFSALFAQAFSQTPGIIYPARVVLMGGVVCLFWSIYRSFEWRLDPVAIGIGAIIGVAWVLIPVSDPETNPPYGDLAGGLLVFWFVARGIGTTLLVPIIEELFFRGYLEQLFKRSNTLPWALGAALATAVIFAALHGRWAEAFAASLAFSYVMHRSGRVTDAIISHGVANAIVFGVATVTGQLHII